MPDRIDEILSYTAEEFAALDLPGCPFLSEQGRTVTRGYVTDFDFDDVQWTLHLRDVDYLDKASGAWTRKRATDAYTSEHSYFRLVHSDDTHAEPLHLVIGGYGMQVFVGPKMDDPWARYAWADVLQTDFFNGGILGRDALPT